jgi:hypothetical protein
MGVDLNRIGLGISSGWSRNGFGKIVSFPSAAGFPAYGTFNSNLTGADYLAGFISNVNANDYYSQYADYIVKNDGAGGTYIDYATASNITYKTGNFLYTTNETHDGNNVTLPYGLGTFPTQQFAGYDYAWNGSGGYTQSDYSVITTYFGQIGENDYVNSSMSADAYYVIVNGQAFLNGKYTYYNITGAGGYSGNDNAGSYHSYGTYITDDGLGTYYYWDGNGGYYTA